MKKYCSVIFFVAIVIFTFQPSVVFATDNPDGFWQADVKSTLAITGLGSNQKEYDALVRFDGQNSVFLIDEPAADYGGGFGRRDRLIRFDLDEQTYNAGIKAMMTARISDLAAQNGKTLSGLVFKKFQAGILPALIPRNSEVPEKIWIAGGGTIQAVLNGQIKILAFIYAEEISLSKKMEASAAAMIGPEGGTIMLNDPDSLLNGVELVIPAGAVTEPTIITIKEPATPPPVPDGFTAGKTIELEPHGLVFSEPVELIIPSEGATEGIFYVYDETENAWIVLPTTYDETIDSFVVTLEHFTLVSSLVRSWCEPVGGTWLNFDCAYFKKCQIATYYIYPHNLSGVSEEDFRGSIERALRTWEDALDSTLKFEAAATEEEADVILGWVPMSTGTGHGDFGVTGIYWGTGKIRFNDDLLRFGYRWTTNTELIPNEINIEEVALHEIGHALGLHHRCLNGARNCERGTNGNPIMAPSTVINQERPAYTALFSDDIERIRNLYKVEEEPCLDSDSDDFPDYLDCDDNNTDIYPGAPEICDELDNQCPGDPGYGEIDEGCESTETHTVNISLNYDYGTCRPCLGTIVPLGAISVNHEDDLTLEIDKGTCYNFNIFLNGEYVEWWNLENWQYGDLRYIVFPAITSDINLSVVLTQVCD